jgi:hypothetical protein
MTEVSAKMRGGEGKRSRSKSGGKAKERGGLDRSAKRRSCFAGTNAEVK